MGAINNVFNQAAGAVAGAGLVIQHARETDFSKMNAAENSALAARNEARAAEVEANAAQDEAMKKGGLYQQLAEAEVKSEKAEKAFNKAVKRKNGSPRTRDKKFTELEAAQDAVHELNNKYQALRDIRDRAKEQRVQAEKATKMALEAQQKFEKHWGGTK